MTSSVLAELIYLYSRNMAHHLPGVSTLAGEFTSSIPKITPEQTLLAYLSFSSSSGPEPRPIISKDLNSSGFCDTDLNLVSS